MSKETATAELAAAFTPDELEELRRSQRKEIAKALDRHETASDREKTTIETSLSYQLMPLGALPVSREMTTLMVKLARGLRAYNRRTGTVRGSDVEAPDDVVFTEAAKLAAIPVADALALPDDVRERLRELTA